MLIMKLVEYKRLLVNENKKLEDKIKKIKLQLANLRVKNSEVNDKN